MLLCIMEQTGLAGACLSLHIMRPFGTEAGVRKGPTCKALGMHAVHEGHMGNLNFHQHQTPSQQLVLDNIPSYSRSCCSSCLLLFLWVPSTAWGLLLVLGLNALRVLCCWLLGRRYRQYLFTSPASRAVIPDPHLGLPIPGSSC